MTEQNEIELKQFRLQAVLSEYQALRDELIQKFSHHLQIYSIMITALAIMFGYVVTEKSYDTILLIPIISGAFAYRYIWEQRVIAIISNYLNIMESEIFPEIIGYRGTDQNQYWVGWEHYFKDNSPNQYHKYTIVLLFVVIPFSPTLFYSIIVILQDSKFISSQIDSFIPMPVHIILTLIYLFIAYYFFQKLWKPSWRVKEIVRKILK